MAGPRRYGRAVVWTPAVLTGLASFALVPLALVVVRRRRPAGLAVLGVSAALAAVAVLLFLTA